MGFLDKLTEVGSAISSKGQEAANKAKELSGVSALKNKISSAEAGIRLTYTELGEKLFAEKADWVLANYPDLMEKVSGFKSEIQQYTQEIEDLRQATSDANAKLQEEQRNRQVAAAQVAAEKAVAKAAAAEEAAAAAKAAEAAQAAGTNDFKEV